MSAVPLTPKVTVITAEFRREACRLLFAKPTTPSAISSTYQRLRRANDPRGDLLWRALGPGGRRAWGGGSPLKESFAAANGGKATRGGRDLPVELIRAGGPALQAKVHGILRDSCRQFAIPPRLKNPALAFLHKPGKPRDVIKKSLRPIGVLSHAGNALGGVVHQWTEQEVAQQGKLGDHLFGNRRGTDAQMAIWASLQIEARALGSGHAVASSFIDVTNCFPSVLHATMKKDLAEVGASEELLALNALLHQDVAYEVRSPSAPGPGPAETVHVAGDAIGFVQGQRAAPAVSTVVMDRRVAHVQQERRTHRPAQEFNVTYREFAGPR